MVRYKKVFRQCISMPDMLTMRKALQKLQSERTDMTGQNFTVRCLNFSMKTHNNDRCGEYKIEYTDNDLNTMRLYRLEKVNGEYVSVSVPFSKTMCERLLHGDIDWMSSCGVPLIEGLYKSLKANQCAVQRVVSYKKSLYTLENGRYALCFKYGICGSFDCMHFLDIDLPMVMLYGNSIVEVKWNENLPEWTSRIINIYAPQVHSQKIGNESSAL